MFWQVCAVATLVVLIQVAAPVVWVATPPENSPIGLSPRMNLLAALFAPGVAAAQGLDFGDAPASYGNPVHEASGPFLGATEPDGELAATPSATADGDDLTDLDDEDAITGVLTQTLAASPTSAPFRSPKRLLVLPMALRCGPMWIATVMVFLTPPAMNAHPPPIVRAAARRCSGRSTARA